MPSRAFVYVDGVGGAPSGGAHDGIPVIEGGFRPLWRGNSIMGGVAGTVDSTSRLLFYIEKRYGMAFCTRAAALANEDACFDDCDSAPSSVDRRYAECQ